jgi:hypothetical protein
MTTDELGMGAGSTYASKEGRLMNYAGQQVRHLPDCDRALALIASQIVNLDS